MPKVDRAEIALQVMSGLNRTEAALLAELESLGRMVAAAKEEIAAMRVENVDATHLPAATDELDEVVRSTADAANEILDVCETLENLQPSLAAEAAETVGNCVTRIYEACAFQDITGQRIGKVVNALKQIEHRVRETTGRYAPSAILPARTAPPRTEGERLANGPQPAAAASSQAEIDALLASFD
ncbi:protein phosphatase CheZ [Roseomonas sp. SSH11]|uniref:Protein phosphatase CheZ n=1 Tax=Pararoseomonas baculiformis TaxID=2820812 RepID=A0ABS4AGT6_9PROT|nr:protein phosphatase CheZ [Pararoseomonas baculiformis]MBP0446242.1 protein phosphatase CheZ [Pararoseomonas baculiformis]